MSLSLMLNDDDSVSNWPGQDLLQFSSMFDLPAHEPIPVSNSDFQGLDPAALHQVHDGIAHWADTFTELQNEVVGTSNTLDDYPMVLAAYEDPPASNEDISRAASTIGIAGSVGESLALDPSDREGEGAEDRVCYGMLHACEVKLVRQDMSVLDTKLGSSANNDPEHMQGSSFPSTAPHILQLSDGTNFGTLREALVEALKSINQFLFVEAEIIGSTTLIRGQVQKAAKPEDAMVQVNINIYGPRNLSREVGDMLSRKKCWLQRPDYFRAATKYENPHVMIFPGLDDQHIIEDVRKDLGTSKPKVQEERLRDLVSEVHNSLSRATGLDKVTGDQRLKITLLEHQQRALAYMLQRESGDIPDRYCLWQKGTYSGQEMFIHRITKSRSLSPPEESGGGVLADEMGMGKTLSSLALLVHTLEDGRKWESNKNSEEYRSGRIERRSHATLVVVPSALLIINWSKEINMHLGEAVKVVRYHGRGRVRDLDTLVQSDIVITTYNTLAAEYGSKRSVLHRIGWYRIILDEAHIIRRQATSFYHACADLEAKSRWCLTGTPIQNRLDDIGALFAFLRAKPFHKISQFRRFISVPFENGETVSRDRLILLYKSLCLRRTKDILKLPGQSEQLRKLKLTDKERDQYKRTVNILNRYMRTQVGQDIYGEDYIQLQDSHQTWKKNSNMRFGLFQAHMQLRILCNHGTFQKPFSWRKRDLKDESDAMIGELGPRSDALCDGCKQPSPVLGLTRKRQTFVEECAHVLCQECLEDSAQLPMVGDLMHCPLCHRLGRAFENASALGTNSGGDTEMEDALPLSTSPSKTHHHHGEYFNTDGISTKVRALVKDIKLGIETSKGIVFSCWTRTLDLIARQLESERIEFLRIDGECLQSKRQPIIDRYATDPVVRVLLMTTGTGAFGLNLTAASRIFIVEPQWNPSTENQAIARAIRLRQERKVEVIRYVIQDTVEEEMRSQQEKKRDVAQVGFNSGSADPVE